MAQTVKLNWTSFSKHGRYSGILTEDAKKRIVQNTPSEWYKNENPWKYADGYFDPELFKRKVIKLIGKIKY